ncbi:hypothetical protein A1OE_452 [Candidatus Endolissoclinum faulkneri L2]|uniref:Uncharacterized protein n=1 Tax=Candidatus Endolissoclinum faulkneri L2 TaxID=1193729 RepID=K7YGB1_9PROT|nr:hypothetical protein A1OE_452 [Candidatus Endolissoclinum faulkneri L2]
MPKIVFIKKLIRENKDYEALFSHLPLIKAKKIVKTILLIKILIKLIVFNCPSNKIML